MPTNPLEDGRAVGQWDVGGKVLADVIVTPHEGHLCRDPDGCCAISLCRDE